MSEPLEHDCVECGCPCDCAEVVNDECECALCSTCHEFNAEHADDTEDEL